jgi:hypothetical protein
VQAFDRIALVSALIACCAGVADTAGEYPLTMRLDARAKTATTTVTSSVTVHVDRLMEENRRKRVADTLQYSGYANFLNALRALPAIGTIALEGRMVEIRYAVESQTETGRRLVLVADRPLLFLGGDRAKPRAGYELTIIELRFEGRGGPTGTMAGAARVKPTGGGGVGIDDYADVVVELSLRERQP